MPRSPKPGIRKDHPYMADKDKRRDPSANPAPEPEEAVGSAADVEAVMKKYDRESNTRIWEGAPRQVMRFLAAAFSLYCMWETLFSTLMPEVRLNIFLGCVLIMGYLTYPVSKQHVRVNTLPWYDVLLMLAGSFGFFWFAAHAQSIIRLATSSIPTVIVDHAYDGCDCVASDNRTSMEQIVRHVYDRGHRRIAFIQGEKGAVSRERLAGFYKICAELGLRVPVEYVQEGHFHNAADCAECIMKLLQLKDKPTCVLCPDDYSCLGALWQLKAQGINVPEDISLVGYDGILVSQMISPCLTTYRQDTARIAQEVFNLMIDSIEFPESHVPKLVTVSGKLVEGETVG